MTVYRQKRRSFQIQCVLLITVLIQILLCAGDIEQNPGPDKETESLLQTMFSQQYNKLLNMFEEKLNDRLQTMNEALLKKMDSVCCAIRDQLQTLQCKTASLEESFTRVMQEVKQTSSAISCTEEKLATVSADLEDKIDKLEAHSRRDNLRFFNIPETADGDFESCAEQVLAALQNTVPGKRWNQDDIVRAHRLGVKRTGYNRRPRPMIVQFSRWRDKMDILTKGREKLLRKGINVAGDLTTKQQKTVQGYRDSGVRAYYKGNQLVVAGPLRYNPLNRGSFADVAQRGVHYNASKDGTFPGRQQGSSRTSEKRQNSRGREDSRRHPHYTERAFHHWDSRQEAADYRESYNEEDYGRSYWGGGVEGNYEPTPYNWQYYSGCHDYGSYPQYDYPPRNMGNLIPVSTSARTDDQTAVTTQGPDHPSLPSSGTSAPPPDCHLSGAQSAQDSPGDTARSAAGEDGTADVQSSGAGEEPGSDTTRETTPESAASEEVPDDWCSAVGEEPSIATEQPVDDTTSVSDAGPSQHAGSQGNTLPAAAEPAQQGERSVVCAVNEPDTGVNNADGDDVNAIRTEETASNDRADSCASDSETFSTANSQDKPQRSTRTTNTPRRLRSTSLTATASDKRQLTISESLSNKPNKHTNKSTKPDK